MRCEDVEPLEHNTFREEQVRPLSPPPPSTKGEVILLRRKRNHKAGELAIGVSVLSVRGWVGSLENEPVDLRLDSCADITLISEEYHASLKNPPPIRQGHRMNLVQLTDKSATIKGYSKIRVWMSTVEDELLEMEAEAYVVKGMSVPILLGEDFQRNYELGVSRNVESGTKILFRGLPYEVPASGIEPYEGRSEVHHLATRLTEHLRRFSKAKEHR
jgi:hypothetical protein